ncbi:MAG: hypothetical protein GEV00_10355 [Actinophytocola sp.]|nr:hypothetical protein [Actinophytocola sp.]
MGEQSVGQGCYVCRRVPADTWLGGEGPLCDRCLDDRVSPLMGLSKLPDPPDPVVIIGPDGRRHRLRYRVSRAPTGIGVGLREEGVAVGEGYEFGVLGDHDADLADLVAAAFAEAQAEIDRMYLEPASVGDGWQVVDDDEVAGVESGRRAALRRGGRSAHVMGGAGPRAGTRTRAGGSGCSSMIALSTSVRHLVDRASLRVERG